MPVILGAWDAPFVPMPGGYAYLVLNRAKARLRLFHKPVDDAAFEAVLVKAQERFDARHLGYCIMHGHMVLWPRVDGEPSRFVGWLPLTHTQRWYAYHNVGTGHLYQGRFKSFRKGRPPFQCATLCRAERTACELVSAADAGRWSSLWRHEHGEPEERKLLSDWLGLAEKVPDTFLVPTFWFLFGSLTFLVPSGTSTGEPEERKLLSDWLGLAEKVPDTFLVSFLVFGVSPCELSGCLCLSLPRWELRLLTMTRARRT